jgi:hypothetical protein
MSIMTYIDLNKLITSGSLNKVEKGITQLVYPYASDDNQLIIMNYFTV